MLLKCISSGSQGNCHILKDNNGKMLLLDLGVKKSEIMKAINFNVSDIVGVVVTHCHKDHSESLSEFQKMGIAVFEAYTTREKLGHGFNTMTFHSAMPDFKIRAFELSDLNGKPTHTNADGSECPCYGFLITHPEMGRLLYITDTNLIKWRFKDINHILLGVNYQKKYADDTNGSKRKHILRGHLELETAKEFIKVTSNNSPNLRNIILCHLSRENAEPKECVAEVQKVAKNANVSVAKAGLEVNLDLVLF